MSVGQRTANIFALGCVFIEIYTVLCGRRVLDFEISPADNEGKLHITERFQKHWRGYPQ